jgi:hypothetical protein
VRTCVRKNECALVHVSVCVYNIYTVGEVKNCRLPNLFRQEYQTELRSPTQSWVHGMANRAGTKPRTGAVAVMLRSGRLSIRTLLFRACTLPAQQASFVSTSPHLSLKNYLPHPCSLMACCCAVRSLLPSSSTRPLRRCAPCSHAPSPAVAPRCC